MSDSELIVDLRIEGLADQVNSFVNMYKSQLIMRGYSIKGEWDVTESVGGKIIGKKKIDLGGGLEVEKKVEKKHKVRLEFRTVDDDIRFIAWPSKSGKEISPVIIDELQKFSGSIESKMKE
ncbi:hypothetical protein [Candidatus Borrarchaeum sp.]|uniref:hypothetical protein n=1 Tax=Candidatus Borrarchaeum sp. TaxID=2846742 RepID=UPI00257B1E04|nr:hypothetical protein [Candidatus Borrarchaeum sp.]